MSFLSKIFNKGPKPIIAHSHEGNLALLKAQKAGPALWALKVPKLPSLEWAIIGLGPLLKILLKKDIIKPLQNIKLINNLFLR